MSQSSQPPEDIWAWLDRDRVAAAPDLSAFPVTALVVSVRGEPWTTRCIGAIEAGERHPERVERGIPDAATIATDWVWLVPDSCEPRPGALAALLSRVSAEPGVAVVGSLLVHPPRRGPGVLISSWAQALTGGGRLRSLVEPGELYQGQLSAVDALGVPAAGMLARTDVWAELGGVQVDLPPSLWGLDFGWRATLGGHRVMAEPRSHVVDLAEPDPPAEVRAAGLALAVAHTPRGVRWVRAIGLVVLSLLAALGYLVGKDLGRARAEVGGLARWLSRPELRRRAAAAVQAVPVSSKGAARAQRLRPARGDGLRRGVEGTLGRLADWAQTFREGVQPAEPAGPAEDEAWRGRVVRRVLSVPSIAVVLAALSLVASRQLVGAGSVRGRLLLPAPEGWLDLLRDYATAVPGGAGVSAAPWGALAGLASLATFGRPDWLITLVFVACVPVAWIAAYRLLRVLLADPVIAGVGAAGYTLAVALTGALNQGSLLVAVWAVVLPIAGYAAWWWAAGAGRQTWRAAAALAVWLLVLAALYPPAWLVAAVAAVVWLVRRWSPGRAGQLALVLLAPLLLLGAGPWTGTLWRFPGRLLTGPEPILAESAAPSVWTLPLAWPAEASGPPLWLSASAFGVLWLAALAGAARRGRVAVAGLAVAGVAVVLAAAVSRVVLWVPPGDWVRATWTPWLVVMCAGLALAAAWGLDGVAAELRGRSLGLRHAGTLALLLAIGAATLASGGWWAWAGLGGLQRAPVGAVPAFVRNALVSPTPGRLLALDAVGPTPRWTVVQDDFARLGDAERGLVVPGDPAAWTLASSVATRLVSGSSDDRLVADLAVLGVSHLWLAGGGEVRAAIGNVPGLGVGTGDETEMVWTVPGSGRVVLTSAAGVLVVGDGFDLPAGAPDRRLVLAEPADPRWRASVAGVPLDPVTLPDGRQAFEVGDRTGRLSLLLESGTPWWAWLQLGGLLLLILAASPGLRREASAVPARRVAGGAG